MPPKTKNIAYSIRSTFCFLIFLLGFSNNFFSNKVGFPSILKQNISSSKFSSVAINDSSSFEIDNDGWNPNVNNGDDFNWTRRQTNTPSGGTGPQNGGGSSGNWFMYIEVTPVASGDRAFMDKSFSFVDQINAQLSFNYHMYSERAAAGIDHMGTLNVLVSTNGGVSFISLFSLSGNQGDNWIPTTIDLSNFDGQNVIIRFEGIKGFSADNPTFQSDISLDEISITSDDNPNAITEGFSFENSFDGWTNATNDDFDWTNDNNGTPSGGTGPSNASEGSYYMYTEATGIASGASAFLERSFDLSGQINSRLLFDYHMFAERATTTGVDHMGTLNVLVSNNNGVNFTNEFSISGNQGNRWIPTTIDLSSFDGQNIILRFEGIKGFSTDNPTFQSDIAIDNVIVAYEPGIPTDTDGDNIPDSVDVDDDNDGILDNDELCVIPGSATPDPDRIEFSDNDFDIFTIGGNSNGLGYQESGFQRNSFQRGINLTVSDNNYNFTTTPPAPNGRATATTAIFGNGTISYSSTNINPDLARLSGRTVNGRPTIFIDPQTNLTPGQDYSINISFTTPVYAFNFDLIDIFDTGASTSNTLRYEIFADNNLVGYFQNNTIGTTASTIVSFFDSNDIERGKMRIGNNIESAIGFITNGDPVQNVSIVHKVTNGAAIQDFHDFSGLVWSTGNQTCFADNLDFDGDGIPNDKDLDSDNDGIPDNIEAQSTIDYITPNYTYNSSGLDTAYPGGINPINTDQAGNSDFVDLDSDDDFNSGGQRDIVEAGFASLDTDNDGQTNGNVGVNGLDNSLYANDDYFEVNGTIIHPTNLPDIDGDVLTVGDVDYRDTHLSGTPLITQILQTPTDRVIEITNIHPTNSILANTIRLSLFQNVTDIDQTGIEPDAIAEIPSILPPNSSILITNPGSIHSGIENNLLTSFSEGNDIILLTHPNSTSIINSWKNRYETRYNILNNTSYVRSDEIDTTSKDFTSSEWITFVDENLDPYRDIADGGPERHPHAPLTSEIGTNANPDSNTSFGLHRSGPTSRVAGNWDNGFPDRTRRVVLPEDHVSNDLLRARTLTISNGSKLTMNNSLLIVSDDVNLSGNNDQIRLAGSSQLIQTHTEASKVIGSGNLHADQNSETNSVFRYNYMSSPVVSSGNLFTLEDVLKDGTIATSSSSAIRNINFVGGSDGSTTSPISIASQWIYTFASADGILSNWVQKLNTNTIPNTDGFTIKGPGAPQNYTFVGTPNDGILNTNIGANQFYLLGNPFPSALSVQRFIEDNTNSINGTLYFWQHAGVVDEAQGHSYSGYIGGYSTRNIAMGVAADATAAASGFDFNLQAEEAAITGATPINDLGTESVLITSPGQSISFNRIGRGVDTLRIRYRSLIPKNLDLQINGITVSTIGFPIQTNYNTFEIPICIEQGNSFSLVSNTTGNINIDHVQLKDTDGQISCSFQISGSSFNFSSPEAYIPVAQGFFVGGSSTGGPIVFNNSQREFIQEGNGQSIFLKTKNTNRKLPILKLGLEYDALEDRRAHRQIGVSFNKNNSFEYDNGYDSQIFDLNSTDMYWKFPNTESKYVIAGVGAIDSVELIPLEIIVDEDKEITIQLDEWNIDNKNLFIYDKLTEEYHSLNNNGKAVFNLSKGTYSNRFFATFQEKKVLNTEDNILTDNIHVFYDSTAKEININTSDDTSIEKAELYTILGKRIQAWNLKTKDYQENRLPVKINKEQLIITKLYTNKGIVSKKILIK